MHCCFFVAQTPRYSDAFLSRKLANDPEISQITVQTMLYLTLVKIACFQASGGRCGWKGISIAFTIRSLDRTYGERMSRPGDRGISITRDLLSRGSLSRVLFACLILFSHLIAIRSFDPTKDATSDSAEYNYRRPEHASPETQGDILQPPPYGDSAALRRYRESSGI